MEFYSQILEKALSKMDSKIFVPGFTIDANKIVQLECYQALKEIKKIIKDDNLSDPECFMKIEEILNIFDTMGINKSNRHDF